MNNKLVPLLHELGIVEAIWLHTKTEKRLTVLRKSPYTLWCYSNNELGIFSISLNTDGTIKGYPYNYTHWTYAMPSDFNERQENT